MPSPWPTIVGTFPHKPRLGFCMSEFTVSHFTRTCTLLFLSCAAAACDKQTAPSSPSREQTVYALREDVRFRAGSSAVIKSLRYAEGVRVQRCSASDCFAMVGGALAAIARADVADAPPPVGTRYLWGHAFGLKLNQEVTIHGFDPKTGSYQIDGGRWVSQGALGNRPATEADLKAREKANWAAKAAQERQQREQ